MGQKRLCGCSARKSASDPQQTSRGPVLCPPQGALPRGGACSFEVGGEPHPLLGNGGKALSLKTGLVALDTHHTHPQLNCFQKPTLLTRGSLCDATYEDLRPDSFATEEQGLEPKFRKLCSLEGRGR